MDNDFSNVKLALFDFDGVLPIIMFIQLKMGKKLLDVIEVTVLVFQELKR